MENTRNTAQNAPDAAPDERGRIMPPTLSEDYSRALTSARIACYDNLRSAPRITEIPPNTTAEFIESLASTVYTQAQQAGGTIPYTAIREVSENFIHAQFREIIVSILDGGNTIRFSDQGPGIPQKDKAQMPGFSSATEPMKRYIRGVGSGLPLVREYLSFSHGRITIEDNLTTGAVVTISVSPEEQQAAGGFAPASPAAHIAQQKRANALIPPLVDREKDVLFLLEQAGVAGVRVTDITQQLAMAPSTAHRTLKKLEEYGLIEAYEKTRYLTEFGQQVANSLF